MTEALLTGVTSHKHKAPSLSQPKPKFHACPSRAAAGKSALRGNGGPKGRLISSPLRSSTIMLAGQCAFSSTPFPYPPIGSLALGCFSRAPAGGSFLQFLIFGIQDLSPLTIVSRPHREDLRSKKSAIHFLWTASFDSAAQAKNFQVFGCGWWCDREIVLHSPHQAQRQGTELRSSLTHNNQPRGEPTIQFQR
jgi:hypothetical protein